MDHSNDNIGIRLNGDKVQVCCTRYRYEFDSILKAKDFIDTVYPALLGARP